MLVMENLYLGQHFQWIFVKLISRILQEAHIIKPFKSIIDHAENTCVSNEQTNTSSEAFWKHWVALPKWTMAVSWSGKQKARAEWAFPKYQLVSGLFGLIAKASSSFDTASEEK